MNTPPTITVLSDLDSGEHRLMATSHVKTEPAGDRLFRGGEFPVVRYVHDSAETAEHDRAALQAYCDLASKGKAPRRKGEKPAEKELTLADFKNAVWQ